MESVGMGKRSENAYMNIGKMKRTSLLLLV